MADGGETFDICTVGTAHTCEGINFSNKIITRPAVDIFKNNRLSLLMDIHQQRETKNKTHKEIPPMASKKEKGVCGSCGDSFNALGKNYGILMCSTCSSIHSHVKNRADIVKGAIDRTGQGIAFAMEGHLSETIKVEVDSKTEAILKRIAEAVFYEGDDPLELAAKVELQKEILDVRNDYLTEILATLGIADPDIDLNIVQNIKNLQGNLAQALEWKDRDKEKIERLKEEKEGYRQYCEELERKLASFEQAIDMTAVQYATGTALVALPGIDKHLLDLSLTFMKNPNADAEDVAKWIEYVRAA